MCCLLLCYVRPAGRCRRLDNVCEPAARRGQGGGPDENTAYVPKRRASGALTTACVLAHRPWEETAAANHWVDRSLRCNGGRAHPWWGLILNEVAPASIPPEPPSLAHPKWRAMRRSGERIPLVCLSRVGGAVKGCRRLNFVCCRAVRLSLA